MAHSVEKTRKAIAKKKGGKLGPLHENSRGMHTYTNISFCRITDPLRQSETAPGGNER
jgi:hypothetical protein